MWGKLLNAWYGFWARFFVSNCWIEAARLWVKFCNDGCRGVIIRTARDYWWLKMPHAYIEFSNGAQIEYVPKKGDLGRFPPPLFHGVWRLRKAPDFTSQPPVSL